MRPSILLRLTVLSVATLVGGCSAAVSDVGPSGSTNPPASRASSASTGPFASPIGPDDCSEGIPAGRYEGSLTYATTGPALTHDSTDGQIRFQVDANGKVTGTWDVAYFVKSGGAQVGTGAVTDGTVGGTARQLLLDGTNVVTTISGSGTSVAWPVTPLTVQEVCDGRVVADWVQTVNDVRQQVGVEAMPAP